MRGSGVTWMSGGSALDAGPVWDVALLGGSTNPPDSLVEPILWLGACVSVLIGKRACPDLR